VPIIGRLSRSPTRPPQERRTHDDIERGLRSTILRLFRAGERSSVLFAAIALARLDLGDFGE
jgi:hypothetical protein